ncbi:Calcineurin-like phosphoesterase [Cyclobacterium lianum]|uniref:Calcineurin-like phosphoesterase n=1 Tax=Cyclobacterium lianum TaxID=388280 RepID=A0A1M7QGU5_9BACT|nr:metallophosphoesterase [Cyclobacterium lianum]SHN30317.1 Calcineurin-like phosphoesterase [Cyclobacterium lianum]
MKFEKRPMVNWYDPKQLAFTAVKTVLSAVFGNFADRRELQAALDRENKFYDYSKKEEIWVDFVSDLGDGFNPTYALAALLSRDSLHLRGKPVKRGDILIMGGDEVYPTPEKVEYDNRLRGPYHAAFPKKQGDMDRPDLFAIPGNHDWYDGLTNFLRLFTQKRSLGNWQTRQSRSYFALKLPHDYWVIAVDVQLNADIDYPQICYFKEIAEKHFNEKSKIILCTSEPSWVYKSFDTKNESFDRLEFFINRVLFGKGEKVYEEKNKTIQIKAVLTGDLHHYARYEPQTSTEGTCQLITAGGGGAFMHPTHTLKQQISGLNGDKADLKKVFPSKESSVRLSFLNLLFPYFSLTMLFFFGMYHLFTSWVLQTKLDSGISLMEKMGQLNIFNGQANEFFHAVFTGISHHPGALFLNLLLFIGIVLFSDVKSGAKNWNYLAGLVHGLLHLCNFYLLFWLFSRINLLHLGLDLNAPAQVFLFAGEMVILGGIVSAILFGLYLTFCVVVLKNHITEASSSYRWEGYKNFLRISIDREGITIFPVGLKSVPDKWNNVGTEEQPRFDSDHIQYDLIEDPIFIKNEKISKAFNGN